jgi:hypothetical protein
MNEVVAGSILEVGQVWTIKNQQIAIIGLSKHLAEYRRCHDGRIVRNGLSDLKSRTSLEKELLMRQGRLTGYVVIPDRLPPSSSAPSSPRRSK